MKITTVRYILSIILFLFIITEGYSQVGTWLLKAPYGGTNRQYTVGFSINNKGYTGTGWDGVNYHDDFWEYDPATNSWTQKAIFPGGARILAVGFSIGSKGYIGTGQDFIGRLNDFWEYNPTTNIWTKKANFGGAARTRAVGFSIGSKGYIGTGYEDIPSPGTFFSDFWEYDPLSNTWLKKANFGGTARREAVGFSIGNKGYIGTGYDGSQYLKDFWQYNPANDSWTQKANIGTAQWLAIGFSIGTKGYIGVGYGLSSPLREFWDYDTLTNKWTRNRDFGGTARFGSTGFSIGMKGYVGTGKDVNNQIVKDFWEFQPAYIYTGNISLSRMCASSTTPIPVTVPYTIQISFKIGNVFTAQISDSAGNFDTPIDIGSVIDTSSGIINANIPAKMIHGYKYRIRVISSNPPFLGSDNGKNLTINPNPIMGMSINDSIQCLKGNIFNFVDTSTVPSGRDTLTLWDFGDGGISSGISTNHSYVTDGFFPVKMRTVTDSGCADSITKNVSVQSGPVASFNASDTAQCFAGNKFIFTNTSTITTGTMTNKWYTGNGDSFTSIDLTYSYPKFGVYKLRLIVTSDQGCIDSTTKQIRVDSAATVDFIMNDTLDCAGTPIIFTNTTVGSLTFVWDFGDGNTFNGKDATHSYKTDGTFIVKLAGYSSSCNDSTTQKVYIKPLPIPDFTVNQSSQNLPGNNFVFTNTSSVRLGTFKSYWDFDDGDTSTQRNTSHSYLSANNYFVKLIIFSDNGCKDSIIKQITVTNSKFVVDFTVSNLCHGDSTLFTNTSSISNDSFLNFLWYYGDGDTAIIRYNPKHLYADTGTYTVKMIALTSLGQKDSVSYVIHILPKPVLSITSTPKPPYVEGEKVTVNASGVFDFILWSTGAQTSTIIIDTAGTYTVLVTSANGCDTSGSLSVEFNKDYGLTAPNTITPNGDGYNDIWIIDHIDKYQPCKLVIYNRWGDELYSTSNYQNTWDGKFNGKSLPEGSYYYVLEAKDGKVYKGVVNVIQ